MFIAGEESDMDGSGEAELEVVTPVPSVCEMVADSGPCRALFYLWHYNSADKK